MAPREAGRERRGEYKALAHTKGRSNWAKLGGQSLDGKAFVGGIGQGREQLGFEKAHMEKGEKRARESRGERAGGEQPKD